MRIIYRSGDRSLRNQNHEASGSFGIFWNKVATPRGLVSTLLVLVTVMILLSAIFGQHGYLALRKQQEVLKQVQQELDRARAEQLRLKKELEELHSPQGIERVAREEIKLAKPGEIVITLSESTEPRTAPKSTPQNDSTKK